ncbi:MAG: FAD-dependent oxidoreductase [Actinomycetota bacterium]|nr:FAD-dependent oxidoreductase [Actinomycetota bacterium]
MGAGPKAVVIGAGVVGCSVADNLVRLGWRDVTVVEQGPLFRTGGSTSHAPGLVFQVNASQTMCRLARHTVERFGALRHEGRSCFAPVGSIELARTPERLEWIKLRHGLASSWGLESGLISPDEVGARIPLIDTGKIRGGLFVPSDGVARGIWAAEAMADSARRGGARFEGNTKVIDVETSEGRVRGVHTSKGTLEADVVVSCAGMWGPVIGGMVGASIPLSPMQHQYVRTAPLPELSHAEEAAAHPILRDQDRAMYFRQEGARYGAGSYQHEPMPVEATAIPGPGAADIMPSLMSFTWDDFKQPWADAGELLPALSTLDIEESFNGLFSFTPDGMPLIGESREVRGFWAAEAVWITHSAGVGKATAEWIVKGTPSIDLRECDLNRFERFACSPAYVTARASQQYDEVYDILHPSQPLEQPRPLRVSPFHRRHEELGAFFLESNGWERPHWFNANSKLVGERVQAPSDDWAGRFWNPVIAVEHLTTRDRVGLYDMTTLKRAEVAGPGALGFLQRLTTNELDRPPGSIAYTLMLNDDGGIRSDVTVARLDETHFQVGLNGPRDIDWLERNLPTDGSVNVRDITGATCAIGLWGPSARAVIQSLSIDDFSDAGFGFFRAREVFVREVPVTALRLSYVGELGWELYTSAEFGLRLWDLLWEAGRFHDMIAGGRGAFNGLRLEKGYRAWGQDMWSEHDPYEAGLGFTVKLDKGTFIGRNALKRRREEGISRQLCCLTVDDGTFLVGKEPVYSGGAPVGFVTSTAYGYSVAESIAYAWLPEELAREGAPVEIEYFAQRHAATVSADPLFDRDMTRMRS